MMKRMIPMKLLPALLLVGCSLASQHQAAAPSPTTVATNQEREAEAIMVARQSMPSASTPAKPSATSSTGSAALAAQTPAQASPSVERTIMITTPANGAPITSPVHVAGEANFWPWEGTLKGVIKAADGHVLGTALLPVRSPGAPAGGPWDGQIKFDMPQSAQTGMLEVYAESAKDGSAVALQTLPVRFGADQPAAAQPASPVELDAPHGAQDVTLPLLVALRVSPPQQVAARLVYSNGATLEHPVAVARGSDGVGYGVLNLQSTNEGPPPATIPGAATLQIVGANGAVLKEATVNVLPNTATEPVRVAWRAGDHSIELEQRVPQTQAIGAAVLNALLNGPPPNLAGADTTLPSTNEIVTWRGWDASWGYRVRLLSLRIEHGVATANFSRELRAYGTDAARAHLIREQIERTLRQFPSVERVVVEIEGDSSTFQ